MSALVTMYTSQRLLPMALLILTMIRRFGKKTKAALYMSGIHPLKMRRTMALCSMLSMTA